MFKRNAKLRNLLIKLAVTATVMVSAVVFWPEAAIADAAQIKEVYSYEVAERLGSVPAGSSTEDNTAEVSSEAEVTGADQAAEASVTTGNVGTITKDNVNVRSGASTGTDAVGKFAVGTVVTVTGQETDSEGKIWYAVTSEANGISGYVREDMIEVTVQNVENEAPVEDTPSEAAPEETAAAVDEYYVQYADDGTGVSDWYLTDSNTGRSHKISELLNAKNSLEQGAADTDSQVKQLRTIIIILAAIIVILLVVGTVLIIKNLHSVEYDEDDEDDEEDDEDEYVRPAVREKKNRFASLRQSRYDDDEDEDDEEDDEDEEEEEEDDRPALRTSGRSKSTRQPKNFLDVDDDLEFEFLDLK